MSLMLGFVLFLVLGLALHPAYFVIAGLCILVLLIGELNA